MGSARREGPPLLLFFIVFLDITAVSLVVSTLPFYGAKFNVSPALQGIVASTYGVLQLIGGPLLGQLSDNYSRKLVLCLSLAGTGISYFGMSMSPSYTWFFLSRLPIGLLKQTESVANSIISDTTSKTNRAAAFGVLQSVLGMAFIIGPLISVQLTQISIETPARIAAAIFLLCLFITGLLKLLPNRKTVVDATGMNKSKEIGSDGEAELSNSPQLPPPSPPSGKRLGSSWIRAIRFLSEMNRDVFSLFCFQFAWTMFWMMFNSNLSLYLTQVYNFKPKDIGYTLSYMGLISVVAGVAPKFISTSNREKYILQYGALAAGISLCAIGIFGNANVLLIALGPLVIAARLFKISTLALLTGQIPSHSTGKALGVLDMVESLARVAAPAIGGSLLHYNPGLISGICFLGLAGVIYAKQINM